MVTCCSDALILLLYVNNTNFIISVQTIGSLSMRSAQDSSTDHLSGSDQEQIATYRDATPTRGCAGNPKLVRMPDEFKCGTCGAVLKSKQALDYHANKKYKCVAPGTPQHQCLPCGKVFARKNLLEQHFTTEKHKRAQAAADAAADAAAAEAASSAVPGATRDSLEESAPATVYVRPRSFGKANMNHLALLSFEELKKLLGIRNKCGLTPFLNLFKLLHLNPGVPKNHNVLLDKVDGQLVALAFKQRHWHEVEEERMLLDCMNNAAVRFLDVESALAPGLPDKGFLHLARMRDMVERETNGIVKEPNADVRKLLRRASEAIVTFTRENPALFAWAMEDARTAPELVKPIRTRDLPEWEPEVGHRWLALAKMQQTGQWPMPPSR